MSLVANLLQTKAFLGRIKTLITHLVIVLLVKRLSQNFMRDLIHLKTTARILFFFGLGGTVSLSVVQRPTALLTFGFIALAGILSCARPKYS